MKVRYKQQWKVQSESNPAKEYVVSLTMMDTYKCSCPNWIFRLQKTGDDCKHISGIKDGIYDSIPAHEFILVPANVREVTLQDDRVTVSIPLIPIGDTDFLVTLLHDCTVIGVPWNVLRDRYQFPRQWTRETVMEHVKFSGRKIYGEWVEERGYVGFEYKH